MRAAPARTATSSSPGRWSNTPGPTSCRRWAARTPVFVRFSTVAGSRGSADTVRDVRGFAVKFYTREGNYDLVGNNIPVFFIQDAMKFPDLVHALKPEPHHEMPQAASAHDTFWDFVSLMPETTHMLMWVMSDRAIPRSWRMMEGFGVHTFRFVNASGDVALRQVPLEAQAGQARPGLGRGAEDRRQGPGLPPPRPVGGHRARRLPRVGAGPAADRRGQGGQPGLRPARPDQADSRGDGAGADGRPAGAQPQPRQLLRRDRAGGLPSRATWCPASTSATTRCCRGGCSRTPTRSCRAWAGPTSTSCRSTAACARSTTSSATACTAC